MDKPIEKTLYIDIDSGTMSCWVDRADLDSYLTRKAIQVDFPDRKKFIDKSISISKNAYILDDGSEIKKIEYILCLDHDFEPILIGEAEFEAIFGNILSRPMYKDIWDRYKKKGGK